MNILWIGIVAVIATAATFLTGLRGSRRACYVFGGIAIFVCIFGVVGALGLYTSREYTPTGDCYECVAMDGEYVKRSVEGKEICSYVLYVDEDGTPQTFEITSPQFQAPLKEGRTPYVEDVEFEFLFLTVKGRVCHIL